MTFYLKYRSKTVDELDLTTVRERLTRVVDQGKYAHAYLFFGPRGTGKTSAARILTQTAGIAPPDVVEMDAASNRGIDDIRELREKVGLLPSSGEKKAYIIDEVHMLTSEAFNALLKTLEEPPSHVMFFLCTTQVEKLPDTVVSRCVNVSFPAAQDEEIIRSVRRVARGEKLKLDDEALRLIVSQVNGSFREAHTILEEAAASTNNKAKITLKDVEQVIGGSIAQQVARYVNAVLKGETQPALKAVEEVVDRGGDLSIFAREILKKLRQRLLNQGPAPAATLDLERTLEVVRLVEERVRTLKYSPLPQLPLEIAALELTTVRQDRKRNHGTGGNSSDRSKTARIAKTAKKVEKLKPPAIQLSNHSGRSSSSITLNDFLKQWPDILANVKNKNHGIVTLLAHCRPVKFVRDSATLEVKYKFHKELLEQKRFCLLIEEAAREVCGAPVRLRYRLLPQTEETLKNHPEDDNIGLVNIPDDELVKTAEEIFGA